MAKKTIFPVTRLHEPLRADVDVEGGTVVDAWLSGTMFRGFEAMLTGRDPRDAVLYAQRICGICSSAHAIAGALAQQQAFNVMPTPNGQHLTNLIFAADLIQNHLRHFYAMVLFDYVTGPAMPPYIPRMPGDYRLPQKLNDEIAAHIKNGLLMAARAHEMMAVFGAKAPHQQTIMTTGVTEQASSERIMAYSAILQELTAWVENYFIPDILTIAGYYKDYYNIGAGPGNFISYGMFPAPVTGTRAFSPGIISNRGQIENFDITKATEEIHYSWYSGDQQGDFAGQPQSQPDREKPDAYSWVKAPRYQGMAFEGGPLARGWINGDYRRGISVMDRLVARAQETLKICKLAASWLEQITPGGPTLRPFTPPANGQGTGMIDVMRGALSHWISIKNNKTDYYRVVTPSTWNFSPRDSQGVRGPVEEALIGTPVADPESLIEVGRVIRSFDPCFSCAVHCLNAPETSIRIV